MKLLALLVLVGCGGAVNVYESAESGVAPAYELWPPCPEVGYPEGSPLGTICSCYVWADGGAPSLNCVFPTPPGQESQP